MCSARNCWRAGWSGWWPIFRPRNWSPPTARPASRCSTAANCRCASCAPAIGPNTRPGLEFVSIAMTAGKEGAALVRTRAPFTLLPRNAGIADVTNFSDPVVLMRQSYRVVVRLCRARPHLAQHLAQRRRIAGGGARHRARRRDRNAAGGLDRGDRACQRACRMRGRQIGARLRLSAERAEGRWPVAAHSSAGWRCACAPRRRARRPRMGSSWSRCCGFWAGWRRSPESMRFMWSTPPLACRSTGTGCRPKPRCRARSN